MFFSASTSLPDVGFSFLSFVHLMIERLSPILLPWSFRSQLFPSRSSLSQVLLSFPEAL